MKRKFSIVLIAVIWTIWAFLAFFLKGHEIDRSEIAVKTGTAIAAHCVESRSGKGVKFKAHYFGEKSAVGDYIALPFNFPCDSNLIDRFNNKPITISFYKNHYLGFEVAGLSIRSVDESISEISSKGGGLLFSLFAAVIFSFSLFMYGRDRKNK